MTGQLFVRETGMEKDGKKILMVFGIVDADELEALTLKAENQYTIKNLELVYPIDRKSMSRGVSPDSLLREPIWKV